MWRSSLGQEKSVPSPPSVHGHRQSHYPTFSSNLESYLVYIVYSFCSLVVDTGIRKVQLEQIGITKEGKITVVNDKLHIAYTDLESIYKKIDNIGNIDFDY